MEFTTENIEKYLDSVYKTRTTPFRKDKICFIFDNEGNSLGYTMFCEALKRSAKKYFTNYNKENEDK